MGSPQEIWERVHKNTCTVLGMSKISESHPSIYNSQQIDALKNKLANRTNSSEPLERISFSKLELEHIPSWIFEGTHKLSIHLSVLKPGFMAMPHLLSTSSTIKTLHITRCNLNEIPSSIGQLTSLTELNLSVNNIRTVPCNIFSLPSLKGLDLSSNCIRDFTIHEDNNTLESLNISDNCLLEIDKSIVKLNTLSTLVAYKNKISSFPSHIDCMPNLKHLRLDKNNIMTITTMPNNIETLSVSQNCLVEFPRSGGINLKKLLISNNKHIFSKGTESDTTCEMRNLEYIEVAHCNICTVPEIFKSMSKLKSIMMAENHINQTDVENFPNNQLDILYLSKNRLTNMDFIRIYTMCCDLTTLSLNTNVIKHIPEEIGYLASLRLLDISDNLIEVLPDSVGELSKLSTLRVSNNQLKTIPGSVMKLRKLEEIRYDNNPLEYVESNVLEFIEYIRDNWQNPSANVEEIEQE